MWWFTAQCWKMDDYNDVNKIITAVVRNGDCRHHCAVCRSNDNPWYEILWYGFKVTWKEESIGLRSGKFGGQATFPVHPIHMPGYVKMSEIVSKPMNAFSNQLTFVFIPSWSQNLNIYFCNFHWLNMFCDTISLYNFLFFLVFINKYLSLPVYYLNTLLYD